MQDEPTNRSTTLNGWKEIAVHLGKSVRSVQRWEATLGLPVRRIRTPEGQIVYADRDEIDRWRRQLDSPPTPEPEDPGNPESIPQVAESPVPAMPVTPAPWLRRAAVVPLALVLFGAGLLSGWWLFRPSPVVVSVVLTARSLDGVSKQGAVVWSYPFERDVTQPPVGVPEPALIDMDGDGEAEWIVPVRSAIAGEAPATSDSVYAFNQDGSLKWSVQPAQNLTYPNRTMSAPWILSDFVVSPGVPRRIWASYRHHTGGSSFVMEIGPDGSSTLRYVQFGRIYTMAYWTTPAGGILAVAGASDEHRRATLALMPETDQPATYPIQSHSRTTCAECPRHAPAYVFLFPSSELTTAARELHPYVVHLRTIGSSLEVKTYQGEGHALFVLNPDFSVASWQLTQDYWGAHKALELEGRLDHTADACPDRWSPKSIRAWTASAGWRQIDVPAGPARPPVATGLQPAVF